MNAGNGMSIIEDNGTSFVAAPGEIKYCKPLDKEDQKGLCVKDSKTDVEICGISADKDFPLRNINITRFINEVPDSMPPFGMFVASNSLYACVLYSHIDYEYVPVYDPFSTNPIDREMISAPREDKLVIE